MMIRWFLLFVILSLTACDTIYGKHGFIHNRSNDYVTAQSGPDLVVPPPLDNSRISKRYYIPPKPGVFPVSKMPPGSLASKIESNKLAKENQHDQTS